MVRIDLNQSGQEVQVKTGETFEIALDEKPTAGFRWEVVSPGAPVCRLLDSSYTPSSKLIGAGGTRVWSFTVKEAGTARIRMAYRRASEPGKAPAREFEIRVLARSS